MIQNVEKNVECNLVKVKTDINSLFLEVNNNEKLFKNETNLAESYRELNDLEDLQNILKHVEQMKNTISKINSYFLMKGEGVNRDKYVEEEYYFKDKFLFLGEAEDFNNDKYLEE